MSDWTSGYVADIGYTFGYYGELNPLRLKLAFLNAGLAVPEVGTACELGFGQGLSSNMHAAASVVQWHGTDFNPAQAGFAQELAAVSGSGAQLHDDAFADFCARPELPSFDYIGLHGIWSWISDDNRAVIVDFVRRKLKVGGVLYISYNTLPGWANFAPMRHLMTQHAAVLGAGGVGIVNRIDAALGFAEQLLGTEPKYAAANPSAAERLKAVKGQSRQYLAHEYFNADWHPMYFADMAKWLQPAKVEFACSAHLLEHVEAINHTAAQQVLLKEVPNAQLRETVRDYMVNQQFRRDYWVKGARRLSALAQAEAVKALRVVLVAHRPDVSLTVATALGEATMQTAVYGPILDAMADHKVRTIAQLEQAVLPAGIVHAQVVQAMVILAGAGHVALAQDESATTKAKKHTDKLNLHLVQKARGSADVAYLASPVTGGAVTVSRFAQLFLAARMQGTQGAQGTQSNGKQASTPADWAQLAWNTLHAQGQQLIKEGKQLTTPEENLAELTEQAQAFALKQLPVLKALMVV